jgi:diacylglycerol kinase (ATP)
VARGIVDSGRDARLALLPAGTGNDFGHGIGLPMHDLAALVAIAVGPTDARIDLGRVDGEYFLTVAGIGIETEILAASGAVPLLHGPLVYVAAAIPKLLTYRSPLASIGCDDGAPRAPERVLAVIASNGPRFGGGFRVAPRASATDGRLDLVTVRDAPLSRRLALFVRVRLGSHLASPEVRCEPIRAATVSLAAPPFLDVDGELVRASRPEVHLECIPARLRLAVSGR